MAMQLTHDFTVPADVETTWAAFNDIGSVAECFPGATVGSVDGDSFEGSVKVKLGPIALVYNGSGTFVEKDKAAHTMRLEAKGKDKRGNGTAGANVTATLTGSSDGTAVSVVTDLSITGKPAQFGRGVMQDVSDKLLAQFVECLKTKVGAPAPQAAPAPETPPEQDSEPAHASAWASPAEPPPAAGAASSDSLDLGATVLPVLAKSYWKQALVGALGVLLVVLLVRRRR